MGYFERHFIEHDDSTRAAKNVIIAIVAVVLSVGLHIMLLHYLDDIPFSNSALEDAQKFLRKHYKPAVVEQKELSKPVAIEDNKLVDKDLQTTGEGIEEGISKLNFDSVDSVLIPSLLDTDDLKETRVVSPDILNKPEPWNVRQEILEIENMAAVSEIKQLPRMDIPDVSRIDIAPDMTMSINPDEVGNEVRGKDADEFFIAARPGSISISTPKPVSIDVNIEDNVEEIKADTGIEETAENLYKETVAEITDLQPIEKLLTVDMQTFTSSKNDEYGYFKLQINRASPEILPQLPSDIMIIQDCSASMTEQKLYFCRQAITNWLEHVSPDNRINIASFSTKEEMCFDSWKPASPENIKKAQEFVMNMRANGNTDIYSSMKNLVDMPQVVGRPVIVLVISDGYSTSGITESTAIIGQFSRLNKGKISVFTLGTIKLANEYLLEQLAYCNRGSASIVKRGRWDIPVKIQKVLDEVKRPVLTDIRLVLPEDSDVEIYPLQTENLYLDRELVLYGRYPKTKKNLIFQAVGEAVHKSCDMIFDIPFESAAVIDDESIAVNWAKQKIYSLMGEYAKTPSVNIMNQINDTARIYKVKLPYRGRL